MAWVPRPGQAGPREPTKISNNILRRQSTANRLFASAVNCCSFHLYECFFAAPRDSQTRVRSRSKRCCSTLVVSAMHLLFHTITHSVRYYAMVWLHIVWPSAHCRKPRSSMMGFFLSLSLSIQRSLASLLSSSMSSSQWWCAVVPQDQVDFVHSSKYEYVKFKNV